MKRKTWILLCCVAAIALLAGVLVWRFVPRKLKSVLPVDTNTVSASFTVIDTYTENGETRNNSSTINSVKPGNDHYDAVVDLLDRTKYSPSLWNLTPWSKMPVQNLMSGETKFLVLNFVWGKEGSNEVLIFRKANDGVLVETRNEVYYLGNPEVMDELTAYICANGTQAP
jgi:hypothetical protein